MRCISPLSIPRPNGRGQRDRVTVPCGKCVSCWSNKRNDWSFRILQELKKANTAYFVTLTYNEKNNTTTLSKIDVQLFLKRLRQSVSKVDPTIRIRYFLSGEYGSESVRPHYHMILFNLPYLKTVAETKMLIQAFIERDWQKGMVHVGSVTEASIMYTTKYMLKGSVIPEGLEPPFSLMSRGSGIGSEYVKRMMDWNSNDSERLFGIDSGRKYNLPRYYKEKMYSKNKLDEIKKQREVERDKKENEEIAEMFKNGENYFLNELEVKNQIIERSKKTKIEKL